MAAAPVPEAPADVQSPVAGAEELERTLGHVFQRPELLTEAMTHRSYRNEHRAESGDNERLEFLGDAILGAAVSDLLMRAHPRADEGVLTRYKAVLVSESALADAGRRLGLGPYLLLGRGEERTGGRSKASVLANTVEAVVAAVFLDAGFDAARSLVERIVADRFDRVGRAERKADYKTRLQEHAQMMHNAVPVYQVTSESGPDHAPEFVAEVLVGGEALATGRGRSKKAAEQAAAGTAYRRLQERAGIPPELDSPDLDPGPAD